MAADLEIRRWRERERKRTGQYDLAGQGRSPQSQPIRFFELNIFAAGWQSGLDCNTTREQITKKRARQRRARDTASIVGPGIFDLNLEPHSVREVAVAPRLVKFRIPHGDARRTLSTPTCHAPHFPCARLFVPFCVAQHLDPTQPLLSVLDVIEACF